LHGIGFEVLAGERVGLIGESGSGKTLTALAVMGLLDDNLTASGHVHVAGERNLLARSDLQLVRLRGARMSMVFQEPMTALDPLRRVGAQVAEVIRLHSAGGRAAARLRAVELLTEVGLPEPALTARAYPHQLSGGQRQRVLIAMALANDPALLIADEPTTALDVTVQARILELLAKVVAKRGAGLLFITHDLALVSQVCERVVVLKDGVVVEQGAVAEVFADPQHEYTRTLLAASSLSPRLSPLISATPYSAQNADHPPPIIRLTDVTRRYPRPGGRFVDALKGISLEIAPGERFGLVGESGSGKTTTLRLLAGLDMPTSGTVEVAGVTLAHTPVVELVETTTETRPGQRFVASAAELARVRANLQLVFQDPMGSLNPRMRVGNIVGEPLLNPANRADIPEATTRRERRALVRDILTAVGLPNDAARRYPHQFSGGQRQRISIARALVCRPKVLVADEPVSALDVSVRAQVLELLARLADEREFTLVLVSHDLAVVRHLCDHIAVMRAGEIVEHGPTEQVWASPKHEYTMALKAATPTMSKRRH